MIQTDNEREISEVLSIYNTPPHSPNQTSQPSNSPFHNYEHPIFPVNKQLQIVNYDTLNARRRSLQPNSIHLNTNTNNFNNFKRRPSFVIETPYTNPTSGNEILTYNPFFLSSFNGTNNESGEKIPDQSCQPLSSDSYFNTKYPDLNLSNNDVDTNINSQSNNQSTILFNSFSSELPQNLNIKNNLQQQIFSASEENVIRRFQPDYYPVEQRRHSIQLIPNPQNANYFSILGDTSISNSSTSTFQNDFHQYDRRQSCIDFGSNQNLKYSSINEDSLNLKLEDFKVKNENFEEENTKAESTTDGDTEFIPLVQGFSKNSKNSKKIAKSYPCHICGRNFARKFNMVQHARVHEVDRVKDQLCPICSHGFYRAADLNRHVRTHTEKGQHVAPCGKSFSRPDAIERHIKKTKCMICTEFNKIQPSSQKVAKITVKNEF